MLPIIFIMIGYLLAIHSKRLGSLLKKWLYLMIIVEVSIYGVYKFFHGRGYEVNKYLNEVGFKSLYTTECLDVPYYTWAH